MATKFRVQALDGRAVLSAMSQSGSGDALVLYQQSKKRDAGDDLDADFGRAGRLRARFVPRKVEEQKAPKGCDGGATVVESGFFVGSLSFTARTASPPSRGTASGYVAKFPGLVCRGQNPVDRHPAGDGQEGVLRVIVGTPPASTTISPPAPFSGSAMLEAPSRQSAT